MRSCCSFPGSIWSGTWMEVRNSWRSPRRWRTCARTSSWTYYLRFTEIGLKNELNGDLNAFLKSPKLGKEEGSPNLVSLEYDYARILMGDSVNGTRMKEIVKEMASGE